MEMVGHKNEAPDADHGIELVNLAEFFVDNLLGKGRRDEVGKTALSSSGAEVAIDIAEEGFSVGDGAGDEIGSNAVIVMGVVTASFSVLEFVPPPDALNILRFLFIVHTVNE